MTLTPMETESIRKKYFPARMKLLLIGESPPHNGKFFYVNSAMTTFTSRPFECVFDLKFSGNQEFLQYFQEAGCFLDDLCHKPVDHLPPIEREVELEKNVPNLAKRLEEWQPEVICIVLRKIEKYVRDAIQKSGINPSVYVLPFPGNGHQGEFMDKLTEIVRIHLKIKCKVVNAEAKSNIN